YSRRSAGAGAVPIQGAQHNAPRAPGGRGARRMDWRVIFRRRQSWPRSLTWPAGGGTLSPVPPRGLPRLTADSRSRAMSRRRFAAAALWLLTLPLTAADPAIKVLIITGDHGHAWKETTPFLKDLLSKAGMSVDVTETPTKDLTAANLAKYDVLLLNYK